MNPIAPRRKVTALGIVLAVAMAGGVQISAAEPGPQQLPASPQIQNRQPDQQFNRRDRNGPQNAENRLERRLGFLHAQLRITPAQEGAWTAFASVLRDEARDTVRDFANRPRGPESVVGRLEQRQKMLTDRSAELDRVMQALRPLYASFSDDQRRTADRLMFRPGAGRSGEGSRRGAPGFGGAPAYGPPGRSGPPGYY